MDERITIDPDICNGRATVRGTRISVQTILEYLGAGEGIAEIFDAYPSLRRDDVLAALRYPARLLANHDRPERLV